MTTEKPQTNIDQEREDRIDEAFGEYLACLDAGQSVEKAEFLAKYPDIADSLAKCLEDESNVRNMAGPTFAETDQETLGTVIGPVQDAAVQETGTFAQSVDTQTDQKPTDWGIPQKFGRYRVKKLLGQGAMGAVYLAEDTKLQRPVALKIPKFDQQQDAGLLERFYREARAVATIFHPNICPILDVGEIEGQVFLSMAFIKGRPLSDFARSDKKQSQRSVAKLVMKLAKALKEAHDIGVVHRDLKPANIMVSKKGGEPVVMDFGLARQLDSNEARVTQSGYIVGTPAYMSPEQVEGASDGVGPQSDQYSLGVVLYELLTGQLPFSGSVLSIIGKIAHKDPTPLAELRADLDLRLADICNKMMAKDPADRFEDMAAVATSLNTFLTESKTTATSENQSQWEINQAAAALESVVTSKQRQPRQAATRKKRNQSNQKSSINRWFLLAGALGFVAILAGIVIFFQNGDGTVRIEITDPKIRVSFADQTFTIDDNGKEIEVTPGKLKLHVERDGLKLDTDKLTISKNGEIALTATWVDGELALLSDGKKIAGTVPVVPQKKPTANASDDNSPSAADLLATGEWEWRIVERLPAPINTESDEFGADITADRLTIVVASKRPGGHGNNDLWIASRKSTSQPWSIPKNLGRKINGDVEDKDPRVSSDGLVLTYQGNRLTEENKTILAPRISFRDSMDSRWSTSQWAEDAGYPQLSGSFDLSSDSCNICGHKFRRSSDIVFARRSSPNQSWEPEIPLPPPINTAQDEKYSSLSNDGRLLLFGRLTEESSSSYDIWMSFRDSWDAPWSEPINLFPGICPRLLDDKKSMLLTMRLKEDDDLDIYLARLVRKDSPVLPIKGLPGVKQIRPASEVTPTHVAETPKEIWRETFDGQIVDLELSPDKKTVALLLNSNPNEIVIFDLANQTPKHRWNTPSGRNIAFSPDGKTIALSSNQGPATALLYDVASGKESGRFVYPAAKDRSTNDSCFVAFAPDGLGLAATGQGFVYIWNLKTRKLESKISVGDTKYSPGLAFSPDSRRLAFGRVNGLGGVGLWDSATGKTTDLLMWSKSQDCLEVDFSLKGQYVLGTAWHGVGVWETDNPNQVISFKMDNTCSAASFAGSESLLLAGSSVPDGRDG